MSFEADRLYQSDVTVVRYATVAHSNLMPCSIQYLLWHFLIGFSIAENRISLFCFISRYYCFTNHYFVLHLIIIVLYLVIIVLEFVNSVLYIVNLLLWLFVLFLCVLTTAWENLVNSIHFPKMTRKKRNGFHL